MWRRNNAHKRWSFANQAKIQQKSFGFTTEYTMEGTRWSRYWHCWWYISVRFIYLFFFLKTTNMYTIFKLSAHGHYPPHTYMNYYYRKKYWDVMWRLVFVVDFGVFTKFWRRMRAIFNWIYFRPTHSQGEKEIRTCIKTIIVNFFFCFIYLCFRSISMQSLNLELNSKMALCTSVRWRKIEV